MRPLGRHLLVELYGCAAERLGEPAFVERALMLAAERAGATILGHHFHRFEPHGVSGVVVIAESHLSIHTWPERAYAAADIFSCGPHVHPEVAVRVLGEELGCPAPRVLEIPRGEPELFSSFASCAEQIAISLGRASG